LNQAYLYFAQHKNMQWIFLEPDGIATIYHRCVALVSGNALRNERQFCFIPAFSGLVRFFKYWAMHDLSVHRKLPCMKYTTMKLSLQLDRLPVVRAPVLFFSFSAYAYNLPFGATGFLFRSSSVIFRKYG
jgi:hypothetical protein